MKYSMYAGSLILTAGLLGACTSADEPAGEPETNTAADTEAAPAGQDSVQTPDQTAENQKKNSDKEDSLTQEEVMSAIGGQLKTQMEIVLPGRLPIGEGRYLTAKTNTESDGYQVTFYSTDNPVPINHNTLSEKQPGIEKLAVMNVTAYSDEQEADTQIAFENYEEAGGEQVDLGFGITGYQDAGVGNLWTSWNEGRWALAAHTSIDQPEKGAGLAKKSVEYLETHALPIPKQHGLIRLDATRDSQSGIWAENKTVYEISDVSSPEDLLDIIVSFRTSD